VLAASVCGFTVFMLYRGVDAITSVARVLTLGVIGTLGAVIVAGFTHMQPALLRFPEHALAPTHAFWQGLGFATLIATYDYWGYYNVCFLGAEMRDPGRTIPRAVLLSIALVAVLYLGMHLAVLGVIPWQELVRGGSSHAAAAMLMERTWGHAAAIIISLLIMWTAFASVAALLLGYSRAPYAAAVDGNYFRAFARLHARYGFPYVSLLALGAAAMLFCFFNLAQVIAALVAVRIVLQYVLQQVGVMVLRWRRPTLERPFRMWFYPLPPLIALSGFLFLLISRKGAERELLFAAIVAVTGTLLYVLRASRQPK
jgi:amino acid transporter